MRIPPRSPSRFCGRATRSGIVAHGIRYPYRDLRTALRHPMNRRRTPASLGELIPDLVEDLGLADRLDEARIEEAWKKLAGPGIGRVTRRVRLHGDRLVIQLESAAWRQALHMQREEWRERINEVVGGERIREIVFR